MSRLRALALGLTAAVFATAASSAPARAATGANDFGAAAPLHFSTPGTLTEAELLTYSVQPGEPVGTAEHCGKSLPVARTAWWAFTGTGETVTVSTALSTFDTVLAVYAPPVGPPLAGNRVACNDDESAPTVRTSKVSFASERGKTYLVQVGSHGLAPRGNVDVRLSAARPANDDRAAALDLSGGLPQTVNTKGASQELGELLGCGNVNFAATVWFKWTATAVGDATFRASAAAGDTAVSLYPAAGGAPLACRTGSLASLAMRVTPGDYLVQAGTVGADAPALPTGPLTMRVDFAIDPDVDGDGALRSEDCNDADASVRPGIVDRPDDGVDQDCNGADAVNLDRDGDGEARPGDCDDGNAAISHGARDVPGNTIDEDCSGSPAPFPRVESLVRTAWLLKPFRLTQLLVVRAVPSKVELRCKGRGCPFKKRTVQVKKASNERSLITGQLTKARLGRGAVLEVRITRDGHIGFLRRVTVGKPGKQPKIADLCLPVGGGKPTKC